MMTNWFSMSRKTSLMNAWNTEGLFARPEWYNPTFIVPGCGQESCLPLVSLSNSNQVVCTAQIKFSEVFGGAELF